MKSLKIMLIIGATLFLIGLIIMLVFLGLNDWSMNSEFEMKSYETTETVHTLDIEFSAGKLVTEYVDDDKISIDYPESTKFTTECKVVDGTLKISNGRRHWYDFIWFGKFPTTTLRIPKGLVLNLNLTLNAGDIDLSGAEFGNTQINLNAGNLNMGNSFCLSFKCELNAGNIDIDYLSCSTVNIEVNAGNFTANIGDCDSVEAKVNAGSAYLNIADNRELYNVAVEKNAGSCNISNAIGTTSKRITAEVNAGSLNVYFKN